MNVSADEGIPRAGVIVSITVSLASISVLSIFLTQKYAAVKSWKVLPWAMWLVIGVYLDSYLFVFATAIMKYGLGLDSANVCNGAIYLCLVAYITSKLIYLFLVEKAYIIRGGLEPRLKSKLWCFNTFGMLGGYTVVIVLNFVFRISHLDEKGQCVIGMERRALLPLILFDLVLNVYLTSLFLVPLFSLYSFQNKEWTRPTTKLHKMAVRTFFGSLATLTSVIVNLSVLTALNGEPGWVCLLCCNTDVLWSAIMIHWVTHHDHIGSRTRSPDDGSRNAKNNGLVSNASSSHTHPGFGRCLACTPRIFSRQRQHRGPTETIDMDEAEMYHHVGQQHHSEHCDIERAAGRGGRRRRSGGGGGGVVDHDVWEGREDDMGKRNSSRFLEVSISPRETAGFWSTTTTTTVPARAASSPGFITSPGWFDVHNHEPLSPVAEQRHVETTQAPPASPTTARTRDERIPLSRYSNFATDSDRAPDESPRALPLVCRRTGMSPGI